MNLQVLGSSSKGNGYVINNETTCLIIEAGIPLNEIKKAIDYKIGNIACCLVTHRHGDHAKHLGDYAKSSIQCYATEPTLEGLSTHHNCHAIQLQEQITIGEWSVIAFPTEHDVDGAVGFLIYHKDTGIICFLTDTLYTKFKFPQISTYLIECNFDEEILENNAINGLLSDIQAQRISQTHMSINTCCELFEANDLTLTDNIVLIHLSDKNSNEKEFVERISNLTKKNVIAAKKGVILNLNICNF